MDNDQNTAPGVDLDKVVSALPALLWTTQNDGRCDFVNRYWCEYTGLDLGSHSIADGRRQSIQRCDSMLGILERHSPVRRANEIDARVRRRDGEYRWFVLRPP